MTDDDCFSCFASVMSAFSPTTTSPPARTRLRPPSLRARPPGSSRPQCRSSMDRTWDEMRRARPEACLRSGNPSVAASAEHPCRGDRRLDSQSRPSAVPKTAHAPMRTHTAPEGLHMHHDLAAGRRGAYSPPRRLPRRHRLSPVSYYGPCNPHWHQTALGKGQGKLHSCLG